MPGQSMKMGSSHCDSGYACTANWNNNGYTLLAYLGKITNNLLNISDVTILWKIWKRKGAVYINNKM